MKEYHSQRSIKFENVKKEFEESKQAYHCPSQKKNEINKTDSSFSEGDGDKKSENLSPIK